MSMKKRNATLRKTSAGAKETAALTNEKEQEKAVEEKTVVEVSVPKAEVKAVAEVETAQEEKATENKPAAEKKKAAAKTGIKTVKRPVGRPAGKKAAKELETQLTVQFAGKSYSQEALLKMAKDVWRYDLKQKVRELQSVELYVKPEENMVYYVMNKDFTGGFYI